LGAAAGSPITNMLVSNSSDSSSTHTAAGTQVGAHVGRNLRGGFGTVRSGVTHVTATVGWSSILYGLGAALIIAVVGSAIASYFIAKIRPAEVMRTE
jgi:putative ABC transport system permease protein